MLVEGVDLLLQVHLILKHLIIVLLQTIKFKGNSFLILLDFTKIYLQLLATHRTILGRGIFILICLEKLLLSILMLLVGILKVS